MSEKERLDYLIRVLSGSSAKRFALKAGIRPDSLSRVRNGRGTPSFYFERILGAFPDVSREWLYTGVGEPLVSEREKSEVIKRIESLEKEVRRLAMLIENGK
jgi:hypothetical protein